MNNNENRIVREMIALILYYGLLLQVVLAFSVRRRLYVSLGLWVGIALAIFMLVYMYRILQNSFSLETKAAGNYVLRHSIIRYVAIVVLYGMLIFTHWGSPLACFAGLLSLKAAAYLQPWYRKLRENKKEKE